MADGRLAALLRAHVEGKQRSQKNLAVAAGVSVGLVNGILSGRHSAVRDTTLAKLARATGIPLERLREAQSGREVVTPRIRLEAGERALAVASKLHLGLFAQTGWSMSGPGEADDSDEQAPTRVGVTVDLRVDESSSAEYRLALEKQGGAKTLVVLISQDSPLIAEDAASLHGWAEAESGLCTDVLAKLSEELGESRVLDGRRGRRGWHRILGQAGLSPLTDSLDQWLALLSRNSRLARIATYLVWSVGRTWTRHAQPEELEFHLGHTRRVLGFARQMCLPREHGGNARVGRDFVFDESNDVFLAALAILVHNLCLMHLGGTAPSTGSYHDRAREFVEGFSRLRRELLSAVDPEDHGPVELVVGVAIEMYRDSPYWNEEATDLQAPWTRRVPERVLAVARILRRCDSLDVGHRFVPDLVTQLFNRLEYATGLRYYFDWGFRRSDPGRSPTTQILLRGEPRFEGGVLYIPFIDPVLDPGADVDTDLAQSMVSTIRRAQEIVRDELGLVLEHIATEEDRSFVNLSLRVGEERTLVKLDQSAILDHAWALFALAVAQPDSDSRAELAVASLLPVLIEFLDRATHAEGDEDGSVMRKETERLLRHLSFLRPNSLTLRALTEEARKALRPAEPGASPPPPVEAIRSSMESFRRIRTDSVGSWDTAADSSVRVFFLFGASLPVAHFLAASASRAYDRNQSIVVLPIYCVRHFASDRGDQIQAVGPALNEFRTIGRQDQLSTMRSEVDQAIGALGLPASAIEWNRAIDSFLIPRICHELGLGTFGGGSAELLFGARAFVNEPRPESGPAAAVTIFGCHALTLLCGALKVPARIVTWGRRLENPLLEYRTPNRGFRFSYSLLPRPGTENERVPLECLGAVSTERTTYRDPASSAEMLGHWQTDASAQAEPPPESLDP